MTAKKFLDTIGEYALIYEGAVLVARKVFPGLPLQPISEYVWTLNRRSPVFWVVPVGICGWLFYHLEFGDENPGAERSAARFVRLVREL